MNAQKRLEVSLLLLRHSVFLVMFVWALDKFVNPGHGKKVFAYFYKIPNIADSALFALGAAQILLVLAFVAGFKKRLSYGLVMLFHGASTFSSYAMYAKPWDNLLFFAAWPMLAACVALYLLREQDRLFTLKS